MSFELTKILIEQTATSANSIVIDLPVEVWFSDYNEFNTLQDTLRKLTKNKKIKVKEIASKPGMQGYGGIVYMILDQATRDMMKKIKQEAQSEQDSWEYNR